MYKYVVLNLVFMALIYLIVSWRIRSRLPQRPFFKVLGILLIMTAVFDSLIIAFGLVTYDLTAILGVYIGKAPIEDFCYTVIAAFLVPALWEGRAKKQ